MRLSENIVPWEKWSNELEKNNKKMNDEFLLNYLGQPPYNYKWGLIDSYYDSRTSFSVMAIRYF